VKKKLGHALVLAAAVASAALFLKTLNSVAVGAAPGASGAAAKHPEMVPPPVAANP